MMRSPLRPVIFSPLLLAIALFLYRPQLTSGLCATVLYANRLKGTKSVYCNHATTRLESTPPSTSDTMASSQHSHHHAVIIVGGGTGGLFTARRLIDAGIRDVVVLEARGGVGGRISTTRNDDGDPLFNNFAWRVSEENTMMRALATELGIELVPQTTPSQPKSSDETNRHKLCKHGPLSCDREGPNMATGEHRPPLSDFAAASLLSAREADYQDRESGYAGRTSQISWPDESHGRNCWIVKDGMDMYPKKIAESLPEGCVRPHHRVTDVEKSENGYKVCATRRDPKDESYVTLEFTCEQVVLAAPPFALRALSVAKDMLPALFSVHERRAGHVYVECKPGSSNVPDTSNGPDRIYRQLPDSMCQQVISGDYGHGIFQGAYASDRFERVWRELQYQGPETVMTEIKHQLDKISNLDQPPEGWDATIEKVHVRLGFVHRWQVEAHVAGKDKIALSRQAITPNPARLPGLYLVGEAFSPFQGWTEGALWTAEKVAGIISAASKSNGSYRYQVGSLGPHSSILPLDDNGADEGKLTVDGTAKLMVYRGLVIDVSDWVQRHPGGAGMIKGHTGEDVSELFDNFHPGWPASLATLFGLQVGSTDS